MKQMGNDCVMQAAGQRGLPFWAWNTELDADRIREQIGTFEEMGFGGFVIHSRNGLRTEYLGKAYMEMVRLAVLCAKERGMKVWIYDEDRWPSGFAGGSVTAERRFRQKSVLLTKQRKTVASPEEGKREGKPYLLAAYRVTVNSSGALSDCRLTDAENANLFAYVMTAENSPRFNGQAYVDTMDPEAVARFIDLTYEKYRQVLGAEFGGTVEAFFTDEPQVIRLPKPTFSLPDLFEDTGFPWTDSFRETFQERYGEDPVVRLPELIWDSDTSARFRYRYNAHIAERFRDAYVRQIGSWCRQHGIRLTGHFLYEDSLSLQCASLRDVMRCYADEDIPGIDILKGSFEPVTALQCVSVAHQMGKKQVMSELYGVCNWTADFRDYIRQGVWQAALGINVQIPHLSWMSMKGEGKRDYPATFGYQSPWYRDFRLVEDYFANLNARLSQGEPVVRIGVLHPLESYWLLCGANDRTGQLRHARSAAFRALCEWLLFGGFPFDLLNEALLPELFRASGGQAWVGKMQYNAVVVPDCLTLRESTVEILEQLADCGVRILFAGTVPPRMDAVESERIRKFSARCETISMTRDALLRALEPSRRFDLFDTTGDHSRNYIFSEQAVGSDRLFCISPAKPVADKADTRCDNYLFRVPGRYHATLYDAWQDRELPADCFFADGCTWIRLSLYAYDTVLIRLCRETEEKEPAKLPAPESNAKQIPIDVAECVGYTRAEDNAVLLDLAAYSFDGVRFEPKREILQIDAVCRAKFGLPSITGKNAAQPWCLTDDREYPVTLQYTFDSEAETEARLGAERLESVSLNGSSVPLEPIGWYTDRDIRTYRLPTLRRGRNVLTVVMKVGNTYGLEPMYLLGDFDVRLRGTMVTLLPPSADIGFGTVTGQGLPFYGGSLVYRIPLRTPCGRLTVCANAYAGALLKVRLDSVPVGSVLLPPYRLSVDVAEGEHLLELECVGNRHNTFGSLHWGIEDSYYGAAHWHKSGDAFSREYRLRDFGILKAPDIFCEAMIPQIPKS